MKKETEDLQNLLDALFYGSLKVNQTIGELKKIRKYQDIDKNNVLEALRKVQLYMDGMNASMFLIHEKVEQNAKKMESPEEDFGIGM